MNTNDLSLISQLSDQQLLAQVKLLAQREREATSSLISHLAVLEERGLYLSEGCSSLFTYCVQVLHLSESATYKRIEVARAGRKYPVILELLGDGSINLTTVLLLAPHLTPENHVELLTAATHQRKRQVEELVAKIRPRPPVPSSIRRLPTPKSTPVVTQDNPDTSRASTAIPGTVPELPELLGTVPALAQTPPVSPARRARIEPLAPGQYKIQLMASAETYEKLQRAQDLLRHQIPDGDLGMVIDRALSALLDKLSKQKMAATDRPRTAPERESKKTSTGIDASTGTDISISAVSRHIPAEVRRLVWERDSGQCAFVAANGHRCTERALLEFHHVMPYAAGGHATIENIQLRCRAHNGHEADRYFGRLRHEARKTGNRETAGRETRASSSVDALSTRSGASCALPRFDLATTKQAEVSSG